MPDCKTCERRNKRYANTCMVFSPKPKSCWAWTDNPDWHVKVALAVKKYKEGAWRDALE